MARKRMIDPSFWEDEKLGTLEPMARLLFMGLISQADDEGRLKGHPSLLRSIIFPYDHDITLPQLDDWLTLLSADNRKLITRYEVDNQKYIFIRNFKKHQTINKPQKSKLPSIPEDYGSTTVVVPEDYDTTTAQKKLKEEKLREEEEKGKEMPAPDSNPHKDHLLALINKSEIHDFNLHHLDIVYSYIGVVDIEVIEAAIKKSFKKHGQYLANTLEGMVTRDGITKKEQVLPKPKAGEPNGTNGEGVRQGGASIHDQPIKGPVGLLPSKYAPNVLQMPKVSG
jgi:hypothetical protein